MGWYLKKSIKAGPFRFTLSKSGINVSTGVPGLRLGTGPRGSYVHMGRQGLYYRAPLGRGGRPGSQPPSPPFNPRPSVVSDEDRGSQLAVHEVSVSEADRRLIPERRAETGLVTLLSGAGTYLVIRGALSENPWGITESLVSQGWTRGLFASAAGMAAAVVAFMIQGARRRRKIPLFYDIDDATKQQYLSLVTIFDALIRTGQWVWLVTSAHEVPDTYTRKLNSGANSSVTRTRGIVSLDGPPHVAANIPIPTLLFGRDTMMFLPDRFVYIKGGTARSAPWIDLAAASRPGRFIEDKPMFHGGTQIDTTWEKVNVDGTPDRRFSSNRQLPIYEYGYLDFNLRHARIEMMWSDPAAAEGLESVVRRLGNRPLDSPPSLLPPGRIPPSPPKSDSRREPPMPAFPRGPDPFIDSAIRRFLSEADSIWGAASEISPADRRVVLSGLNPPGGEGPAHVTIVDMMVLFALIGGADGTFSHRERTFFDQYFPMNAPGLSESGLDPIEFMAQDSEPVLAGFRGLLDFDKRQQTRLAARYAEAALSFATLISAFEPSGVIAEAHTIDEIRTAMQKAARAAGAPDPFQPIVTTTTVSSTPESPLEKGERLERSLVAPLLAELDGLIGLDEVKHEVRLLTDFIHIQNLRVEAGLPTKDLSHHLVFTGNPGTGKTTVARILAKLYGALSVVSEGHVVEVDRSRLVGSFVGQTAPKVRGRVEEALGGVLFIDEAYALAGRGEEDYGREAIDTLVKQMEDHRDNLAVIFAGYPRPMEVLLSSNPGLASRVRTTIHFPDYTTDELLEIFQLFCDAHAYELAPEASEALQARLAHEPRGEGFGNGRLIRNWFEDALTRQASRLVRSGLTDAKALQVLIAEDVRDGSSP